MNEAILQDAMRLRRAGRLAEAAALYSAILREQPRHFEALHALGILRYQAGALDEAERLIGEAVLVNPEAADALYNRGSLLMRMSRPSDALACFGRAIALKPDYAEAFGNRGALLMQFGRPAEALADFETLVRLRPSLPQAWFNLGGSQMKLDRLDDAYESYGRALALKPDYADARRGRGSVAFTLGRHDEALADADAVLKSNPRDAAAWELRGNVLSELGRHEEALASYDNSLALVPANADALYHRGHNLMALRRVDEAARAYEKALGIAPDRPYARGYLAFAKLCSCDWAHIETEAAAVTTELRAEKLVSPFHALVLCSGAEGTLAATRAFAAQNYPPQKPLWTGERYANGRIRVAYLSANFHDHAVARQIAGVLEHHDHARFEVIGFSYGPEDGGVMRPRLKQALDRFIDVRGESASAIARRLRENEIGIAVDLMGFTELSRPEILSYRPSPVQVNFLGYPGTMGLDYVDYLIADATVIPESDSARYAEKLVRLPHAYLCTDNARAISPRVPSRTEAGLPETGFVFCCFNHSYKIVPAVFEVWMRLLRALPESVLWLSPANAAAAANLKREAAARGVDPKRIVFADYVAGDADHLARLTCADLFLDTLPYNAHATASDALWSGVPVLTVKGEAFPGRVAASLLSALGMEEMVASSLEAYETMALKLARDAGSLAALKAKLARQREIAPLFDTARFTRNLERAFTAMWELSQRGLAPEAFRVTDIP